MFLFWKKSKESHRGEGKAEVSQLAVPLPQTASAVSTEYGAAVDSYSEQRSPSRSTAKGGKGDVVADLPG